MKAKKYILSLAMVYMAYFTHGIQAIILSQNQVNFYTQWGYTDAVEGAAAVLADVVGGGGNRFWKNADRVAWRRIFRPDRAEENGNRRWNPLYHLFCRTFVHF